MASVTKYRRLQKKNKKANHGRKPAQGKPNSQFKR